MRLPVPPDLLLLALGLAWAGLAVNVYRPFRVSTALGTVAFFAGWLVGELALHHALVQMATLLGLAYLGALGTPAGVVGAALTVASAAALVRFHERGHEAESVAAAALVESGLPTPSSERVRRRSLLLPFRMVEDGVVIERNLPTVEVDGHVLEADVFRPANPAPDAPLVVYVHGGAWMIGYRRYQGLPILNALAKAGFVCVSVSYRLSPRVAFPTHLQDVLRGVAWAKAHAAALGANPRFVAVVGNSAGAHLAALTALAHDDPGFVPDDLRGVPLAVDACVGLYGVYDFTNSADHWAGQGMLPFLERVVMKQRIADAPEAFANASPIARVRRDAPPFLVIHGDRDTLAPVGESRRFVAALRATSAQPVTYCEVEGAQHAFEIFHSVRGRYVVRTIAHFLTAAADAKRAAGSRDEWVREGAEHA